MSLTYHSVPSPKLQIVKKESISKLGKHMEGFVPEILVLIITRRMCVLELPFPLFVHLYFLISLPRLSVLYEILPQLLQCLAWPTEVV